MSRKSTNLVPAVLAALAATVAIVAPAQAREAQASGEVRRVNVQEGKITIRHGEIPDLQLPAMSLVYRAEPGLLTNIQPGDKITFSAKREGDHYVVTQISK